MEPNAANQKKLDKKRAKAAEPTEVKPHAFESTRADGFTWLKTTRDQWVTDAIPTGECATPRIRELDKKTYAVYRDGKYLGCEATFAEASARAKLNKVSEKNRVMKLWEEKHPDELPPGLQLSDVERAEYWRRHPLSAPKGAGATGGRAATPSAARAALVEDAGGTGRGVKPGRASDAAAAPQGVIRVRAGAAIPKKPGTSAHARWAVLWAHDGKTVEEFLGAKGNPTTLANAIEKKFVTVEDGK